METFRDAEIPHDVGAFNAFIPDFQVSDMPKDRGVRCAFLGKRATGKTTAMLEVSRQRPLPANLDDNESARVVPDFQTTDIKLYDTMETWQMISPKMVRQDYIFYFPGSEDYEQTADGVIEPQVAKLHAKYSDVLPGLQLFQDVVTVVRRSYTALVIDVRNKKFAKFNAKK